MSAETHEIPPEPAHMEQNTGPPMTPQRVQDVKRPKSTPNNRGSAVASEYLEDTTVDALLPSLLEDIKNHKRRDIKSVIGAFLMSCVPEDERKEVPGDLLDKCLAAVLPICNGETDNGLKVRSNLEDYASVQSQETDGYKPFVLAFNHALKDLKTVECDSLRGPSDLDIMFHRNDPMPIMGEHNGISSARKPDTILASFESVKAVHPDNGVSKTWEGIAFGGAGEKPKKNFHWKDVLHNDELRLSKKKGRSTVRVHYKASDEPVYIPPQVVPNAVEEPYEAGSDSIEADTDPTEASKKSQLSGGRTSRKGSAKGKGSTKGSKKGAAKGSAKGSKKGATKGSKKGAAKSSAKGSARDSGKSELPPLRRSNRLASAGKPTPLGVSSTAEAEGASSGKRKRDAEPHGGSKKRSRGPQEPQGPPKIFKRVPAMLQSASYAAGRMSHAFWVTHVINLVIIDNVAYVWYYDSQNSVQSCGIDFVHDLPYFLVLLLAFQRFELQNWGVMKEFKATPDGDVILSPSPEDPGLQFEIESEKIRGHYGLRGRCTQVLKTTSSSRHPRNMNETLEGVEMVSKFYWPQESRATEADILEKAHAIGKKSGHVRGHLPDMIYTKDFDQYSTMHIRELLGMDSADMSGQRLLRWIVFRRLYPITDLVGAEFWKAFWECFLCHLHLWRAGVRHCDISVSNLMYDKRSRLGILNDFDLALLRGCSSPSGTERTGTMPFMAMDLLIAPDGEVKREYHHDVESFAWVLLWICCTYEDGKELSDRPLQALIQPSFEATYKEKLAVRAKLGKEPTGEGGQVGEEALTDEEALMDAALMDGEDLMDGDDLVDGQDPDGEGLVKRGPVEADPVKEDKKVLKPTASYSDEYFRVAVILVRQYLTRHFSDPHKHTDDRPESAADDLEAIRAELRICRRRLVAAGLPANIF